MSAERSEAERSGMCRQNFVYTRCIIFLTQPIHSYVAQSTPLRKTTTVNDFAEACVFFAADASNAVTGQSLSVDGGLTMP